MTPSPPSSSCRPLRSALHWACVLILAGVFGYAGAIKIIDPAAFAEAIRHYRLLPDALVPPLALYLPWLEVIVAAALLVPRTRRAALLLTAAMLVAFIAALASAWARGLDIDCGCFGKGSESVTVALFVDLGLLALVGGVWLGGRSHSRDRRASAAQRR